MANENQQLIGNMKRPDFDFSDPSILHDRILIVEGRRFHVQSGLLSIWCEYFNTLFNGDFDEANTKEIKLEDISAESLTNFLKLIYPGRFEITEDNLLKLMILADRFTSPGVMDLCQDFINGKLETMDKITLLEYAFQFGLTDIKEKIAAYVAVEKPNISYKCNSDVHHRACNCTPRSLELTMHGYAINQNNFLAKNYNRVMTLSNEIKAFIFEKILTANYKM